MRVTTTQNINKLTSQGEIVWNNEINKNSKSTKFMTDNKKLLNLLQNHLPCFYIFFQFQH